MRRDCKKIREQLDELKKAQSLMASAIDSLLLQKRPESDDLGPCRQWRQKINEILDTAPLQTLVLTPEVRKTIRLVLSQFEDARFTASKIFFSINGLHKDGIVERLNTEHAKTGNSKFDLSFMFPSKEIVQIALKKLGPEKIRNLSRMKRPTLLLVPSMGFQKFVDKLDPAFEFGTNRRTIRDWTADKNSLFHKVRKASKSSVVIVEGEPSLEPIADGVDKDIRTRYTRLKKEYGAMGFEMIDIYSYLTLASHGLVNYIKGQKKGIDNPMGMKFEDLLVDFNEASFTLLSNKFLKKNPEELPCAEMINRLGLKFKRETPEDIPDIDFFDGATCEKIHPLYNRFASRPLLHVMDY